MTKAPRWLSTDLRDGNQALIDPMSPARKREMFDLLIRMGYQEIEVGFPSASQADFDFVRELIEGGHIPGDVQISVLTQARDHLIERTVESRLGAAGHVHLYNATAPLFRRWYSAWTASSARRWPSTAHLVLPHATPVRLRLRLQYSRRSSSTPNWISPSRCARRSPASGGPVGQEIIFNLPCTVERSTPSVYADQIEWMSRQFSRREHVCLSVHTHNDRGTAVADAELAIMAGATGSRAACSATASGPATSAWLRSA